MLINNRLVKGNVVHTHDGILCSYKTEQDHVIWRYMDGAGVGRLYPQQTNAGIENQTPHILTYKWELNNENTGKETTHTGANIHDEHRCKNLQ